MFDVNYLAVLITAVVAFIASGAWYAVFGNAMVRLQKEWRAAEIPEKPDPWKMLGFFVSGLVTAFALAILIGLINISGWLGAAGLGVLLWIGFAATQWLGSILGEDVPLRLAAIHAGDWLIKLVLMAVLLGVWR